MTLEKIKNQSSEDDINLKYLLKIILREKKALRIIVFLSTVFSILYSTLTKPTWEGRFEIVVNNEDNSYVPNVASQGLQLLGIVDDSTSDNETQRLILKSEYVLMPVFEYAKNYKESKGLDTDRMFFKRWVEKFDIEYEEPSSVLQISFQNKDKEFILNVLDMISERYKDYSRLEKEKEINNTINYLTKQQKIMSKKALISSNEFNSFAIENGLGNIDGFITNEFGLTQNIDAANSFSEKQTDKTDFSLPSLPSPSQRYVSKFNLLEESEAKYSFLATKLSPNSKTLRLLKNEIDSLKLQLKKPNEILVQYKTLGNIARRDEFLLENIKNNLETAKLDKVKTPSAFQTITKPSIDPIPVYPKKILNILGAFISSIILGSFFLLLKEKFSGRINDKDQLFDKIDCDLIEAISQSEANYAKLLIKEFIEKNNKLAFVNLHKKINLTFLNDLIIENNIKEVDFNLSEKFDKTFKYIIFVESGMYNYKDIELMNKYIKLFQQNILGYIFIGD